MTLVSNGARFIGSNLVLAQFEHTQEPVVQTGKSIYPPYPESRAKASLDNTKPVFAHPGTSSIAAPSACLAFPNYDPLAPAASAGWYIVACAYRLIRCIQRSTFKTGASLGMPHQFNIAGFVGKRAGRCLLYTSTLASAH